MLHARIFGLVTRAELRASHSQNYSRGFPLLFPYSLSFSLVFTHRDQSFSTPVRSVAALPTTLCRVTVARRRRSSKRRSKGISSSTPLPLSLSLSLRDIISRYEEKEREREECRKRKHMQEDNGRKGRGTRRGETEREWRRPRRGERRAEMETRRCRWAQKHEIFNPIGSYISAPPSHPIN